MTPSVVTYSFQICLSSVVAVFIVHYLLTQATYSLFFNLNYSLLYTSSGVCIIQKIMAIDHMGNQVNVKDKHCTMMTPDIYIFRARYLPLEPEWTYAH